MASKARGPVCKTGNAIAMQLVPLADRAITARFPRIFSPHLNWH
jgi:hypothetical protein